MSAVPHIGSCISLVNLFKSYSKLYRRHLVTRPMGQNGTLLLELWVQQPYPQSQSGKEDPRLSSDTCRLTWWLKWLILIAPHHFSTCICSSTQNQKRVHIMLWSESKLQTRFHRYWSQGYIYYSSRRHNDDVMVWKCFGKQERRDIYMMDIMNASPNTFAICIRCGLILLDEITL